MNDIDWPTYLAALSTNQSEISRAAGVSTATVSRWFSRSAQPLAPQVIAVARAYDESPVVALVAAGYLTRDEIEREVKLTPGMSLAEFTELEIAEELVRRIEGGQTTAVSDAPLTVDHPAWERTDVGGPADDEDLPEGDTYSLAVVLRNDEVTLRTDDGQVYSDVDAAFRYLRTRLQDSVEDLEELRHAAKNRAREVEEDLHTP